MSSLGGPTFKKKYSTKFNCYAQSLKLVLTGLVLIYFRRSVRSSYAFAHQEGFGRLITSGKIMRQPPSAPYPAFQVRTFSTNFFYIDHVEFWSERRSKSAESVKSDSAEIQHLYIL